ncbi:MAG TPA: hypothetical protein VK899_07120 [Gemmatimonadales bacterium]|nr:hypothetical protein [Gemmatimonadales bacterium]
MAKPLNLPADLIEDWAKRHAAANAKLEGRELPADYVRPLGVEEFLARRRSPGGPTRPGQEAVVNANGEIVTWV